MAGADLRKCLLEYVGLRIQEDCPPSSMWSIYRVPRAFLGFDADAYHPQTVSIGPFHCYESQLQNMEAHKKVYMQSLLQRTREAEKTKALCRNAILRIKEEARNCYSENLSDEHRTDLPEILLVDGCFIIELFLRYFIRDFCEKGDPIFESSWMISALQRDLVLLENQIPFFVLDHLFLVLVPRISERHPLLLCSLTEFSLQFFKPILVSVRHEEAIKRNYGCVKHLLDLVHKCYEPPDPIQHFNHDSKIMLTQGAIKLQNEGIRFKKCESYYSLLDIKFEHGILEMPQVRVEKITEPLLRNLIAYEQCYPESKQPITSFAVLMDSLIDKSEDAELLEKKSIIMKTAGHSEDITKLFNNMCKDVVLNKNHFSNLVADINTYCKKWWPRLIAVFRRDYCSDPFKFAAFLVAAFILFLTIFNSSLVVFLFIPLTCIGLLHLL